MRPGHWILAIVSCLMIITLGGHFYLVRLAEGSLEAVASRLAPTGRLTWERIRIHPSGQLRVSTLRFEPREFRDFLRAEEISFQDRNLVALIQSLQRLDNGLVPGGMLIRVRGVRLPVGAPFANWLEGYANPGLPFAGAGCEYNEQRLTDLNRLDYWELALEGQLDYQFVAQGQELELRARLAGSQLSDWSARARLSVQEPVQRFNEVIPALAASSLLMGEIQFIDLGFHGRLMDHCSAEHRLTPRRWQEQHLDAWRQAWHAVGLAPDDIAESAYRSFLSQPGSVSLEARLDPPLALTELAGLRLRQTLPTMDILYRVNESALVPLGLAQITPPPAVSPAPAPEEREPDSAAPSTIRRQVQEIIDPATQALPPRPPPPGWRSVALDTAPGFLGQSVRLVLADETRASGRLIDADDRALHLEIRSRFGLLARPFSRDRIVDFQVPEHAVSADSLNE